MGKDNENNSGSVGSPSRYLAQAVLIISMALLTWLATQVIKIPALEKSSEAQWRAIEKLRSMHYKN